MLLSEALATPRKKHGVAIPGWKPLS